MNWFRQRIKTGSRLALFALAIQLALSFGHFHGIAAQAATAVQAGAAQIDLATAKALDPASEATQKQQPSSPDTDRQPADSCAICAVIALAGNVLFATPPVLPLPHAIEFRYPTTAARFDHLRSEHIAFQSRAPPVS